MCGKMILVRSHAFLFIGDAKIGHKCLKTEFDACRVRVECGSGTRIVPALYGILLSSLILWYTGCAWVLHGNSYAGSRQEVHGFSLKPKNESGLAVKYFPLNHSVLSLAMMNVDNIAALCATMSLKGKEGPIQSLKDELEDDGLRKMSLSLVGKVLANKLINQDAFRRVLLRI
ncbi:hypothetical protein LWI29_002148 [Acer saccharum]|uniref:Uncharacterized protein n=1 Tax=Acer saccharum TaxID=4024 RepID=A0AA39RAK5_ACESA|nr:hypothetical protein LWI29_002148 [Acer saccharum]